MLQQFAKGHILYIGVKTWIIKNIGTFHTNICWHCCPQYIQDASWFLLSLLPISIRAFRWCNRSWWTWFPLHTHGTQAVVVWYATWAHPFFRKIPYYASIMPKFKSCWLCSILCWHTILKLKPNRWSHHHLRSSLSKACTQAFGRE